MGVVDQRIVGCCGHFDLCSGPMDVLAPPSEDVLVIEVAATRVIADAGGLMPFSLQDLFVSLRVVGSIYANAARGSGDTPLSIVGALLATARRSGDCLDRAGFEAVDPVPGWLRYEAKTWAVGDGEAAYVAATPSCVASHARRLVDVDTCVVRELGREESERGPALRYSLTIDVP